jgi:hypothetical protein
MLAVALIIVGLLILVATLPPLVLDLTGHIKYVPAGNGDNQFKKLLTDDITKYVMLGTGILSGLVITGLGIWVWSSSDSKDSKETNQYGQIPRSSTRQPIVTPYHPMPRTVKPLPQIPVKRNDSTDSADWPPNLSRVNTPSSDYSKIPNLPGLSDSSQMGEYGDPAWLFANDDKKEMGQATLKRRSSQLEKQNNPESPYGSLPRQDGYGNIPADL